MGKYYRMQSPFKTAIWYLIISLVIIPPGLNLSIIEAIVISATNRYGNVPSGVWVSLPINLTIFVLMMLFKKKYPRAVTILGNTLMLVQISLFFPQLSYYSTLIINILLTNDFASMDERIAIYGNVGIILFFASFRLISRLRKSFADCEPESDTQILLLWVLIVVIHVVCIVLPISTFMFDPPEAIGLTGYLAMITLIYYIFPIAFMVKMVFSTFSTIKEFRRDSRKGSLGINNALIVVIFVFSLFPLVGHIIDHGENNRDHSIYNKEWDGNSAFAEKLVNETMGYDVYNIQSSLSALLRMNRSVCLVIMGPTTYYNPLADIPFFLEMFKDPNFSMLICDDHGSTSSLMIDMFIGSKTSGDTVPLALFPNGILYDNASYEQAPYFPIITDFEDHETTNGVTDVILSKASALLGGDLLSLFGWEVVGRSSAQYSWVDVDENGVYDYEVDNYPLPSVVKTALSVFGIGFEHGIPLGGYPQITFAHNEMENGNRLFLTTDASMFNNELLYQRSNSRFAENIINWLTRGNRDIAIVFDESHNTLKGTREFSSAAMFGLIQGYVNWLSTNPFLSWIYPLYALRTISKRLPKDKDKKKKKKKEEEKAEEEMEELKFRTSSFFAKKINWYRLNKEYNKALTLLSKRLDRKIQARMGGTPTSVENIIEQIQIEQGKYITEENLERIRKFLIKLDDVKNNKLKIIDEEEFNDLFFEMSWVAENI